MAVISLASLKGGVGKTSCAVNLAHAFAGRGCEVILLDLDPAGHATRLLKSRAPAPWTDDRVPLAQLLLSERLEALLRRDMSVLRAAPSLGFSLWQEARKGLAVMPGGAALEQLESGHGAQRVIGLFDLLCRELAAEFDTVVIDTAPRFAALAQAALAASNVAVVPVDMSVMSIWSMEELAGKIDRLEKPVMAILRTMVNRQASRVRAISESRLHKNLTLEMPKDADLQEDDELPGMEDFSSFISRVAQYEQGKSRTLLRGADVKSAAKSIYLLESMTYRTEQHNRLSCEGKTAFDEHAHAALAGQYVLVARELEKLLCLCDNDDEAFASDSGVEGTLAERE